MDDPNPPPVEGVAVIPFTDFDADVVQVETDAIRDNQHSDKMPLDTESIHQPTVDYSITAQDDFLNARQNTDLWVDFSPRENAPHPDFEENNHATHLSHADQLFHAGSNQYHNMMPINTNSSNPQNTQAYGQQDFQNDTTKMDTMNDYHYGINNEKIPSTFQSIQEAPFPSRQHTLGLNHSNSLSTIFDSPYDETHIQAGSNPSLDANQIDFNQYMHSMAFHPTPRQLDNMTGCGYGYGMGDGVMAEAEFSHVQGANGYHDMSALGLEPAGQNYGSHMTFSHQGDGANRMPNQIFNGNYGVRMPVNSYASVPPQSVAGNNEAHMPHNTHSNAASIQHDIHNWQSYTPANLSSDMARIHPVRPYYGPLVPFRPHDHLGELRILGQVGPGLDDTNASQSIVSNQPMVPNHQYHMSASVYGQLGVPFDPNQFDTSQYRSDMISSPPLLSSVARLSPPFQMYDNLMPRTADVYNGAPQNFGTTKTHANMTTEPDAGQMYIFQARQFQVPISRVINPNDQPEPSPNPSPPDFPQFQRFPTEVVDLIFIAMFPERQTRHLGLILQDSFGRRKEHMGEWPKTLWICGKSRQVTHLHYRIVNRPDWSSWCAQVNIPQNYGIPGRMECYLRKPLCFALLDTFAISEDLPEWTVSPTLSWLDDLDKSVSGGFLASIKRLEVRDNHTKNPKFLEEAENAMKIAEAGGSCDFSAFVPRVFTNGILDKFPNLQKLTLTNIGRNSKVRRCFKEEEWELLRYMISKYLDTTRVAGEDRLRNKEDIKIREYEEI